MSDMLPRLVTNTNINFLETPHLGLASLMLEAGYTNAEDFITYFKDFFEHRSIYSFLRSYAYIVEPAVAACLYLFSRLLGDNQSWDNTLNLLVPSYTAGFSTTYNLVRASTVDNYKAVLDWFGYPFVDVTDFIQDPFTVLSWIESIDSTIAPINDKLLQMDLSGFMRLILLKQTFIDVSRNTEYHTLFRRWVNLAFTRYAYGADANQIRWF